MNKKTISGRYFTIELFECSQDIVLFAASLGFDKVTVENFTHFRNSESLQAVIKHGLITKPIILQRYQIDFTIAKSDFIDLISLWNNQGCYAVFHKKEPIRFKATDLDAAVRYRALDNFEWNLEIAIPGSNSDGWGQITSPDEKVIAQIESKLKSGT